MSAPSRYLFLLGEEGQFMRKPIFFVIVLVMATILACGFSVSTANIKDVTMARDPDGAEPTTTFTQDDNFYAIVEVANAPDDTTVKAEWVAVEADGIEPNFVIGEKELVGGGTLTFSVTNSEGLLWPVGRYKVDLYLNDEFDRTVEFEVEGQAVVEVPTDTPEPSPTPTLEPEPVATPTGASEGQAGDSVAGDTLVTKPSKEPEPLPFLSEPYIHPSGAFGFAVPEGWELVDEDEAGATYGDTNSFVGVTFFDAGGEISAEDLKTGLDTFADGFLNGFADSYELVAEDSDPEQKIYFAAYTYESLPDGAGDADIFIEQQDTVVYIFYFVSSVYNEMKPTWDAIIDSYAVDPEAVVSVAPTPAATPTPLPPPPSPTPAPSANQFAPPPNGARVYLQNFYNGEYYIDFGDGKGSVQVPAGTTEKYHDVAPGKYTPSISLFGGATVNVEFEIGPNQSWVILVSEDLQVKWGQVYP